MSHSGTTRFSELWGKSAGTMPFLTQADQLSTEDTRRWYAEYVEITKIKDRKRKKMGLHWGFSDGALYRLYLRFRYDDPGLAAWLRAQLGREPDRHNTDRWDVSEQIWLEADMAIVLRVKAKGKGVLTALIIADRDRWETAWTKIAAVQDHERTIYRAAKQFRGRKTDLQGALSGANAAVEALPSYGDAWNTKCEAHYDLGDFGAAEQACRQALDVSGDPNAKGRAEYLLGCIALAQNNRYQGLERYRAAMSWFKEGSDSNAGLSRRLRALEGDRSAKVMKRAAYALGCYQARGQGRRQHYVPQEFGFRTSGELIQAAWGAGVDVDKQFKSATSACK